MSLGMILLVAAAVLVLFGVGQRVLDRMRLNDRQALLFIALIFIGGWIPSIPFGPNVAVNIGGALIPFGLCVYLFFKADTAWERWRAVLGSLLSATAVFLIGRFFPNEPEAMPFDPKYLYGIAAGLIAYIMGRSRIASFISGVMGVLLADIAQAIWNQAHGIPVNLNLGGAGAMDTVILSGFLAVILAEVIGETLERFTGAKRNVRVSGGHAEIVENGEKRAERRKEPDGGEEGRG
ncbi:MAG: DUF1614 domain-containing protein [Christensenellaceae bacterium]|nr:DUF1614 domain-containing protein [Christensenellaceae bacterium]